MEKKEIMCTFSKDDLGQMAALGISPDRVLTQVAFFQRASGHLRLRRPCLLGDGIQKIPESDRASLMALQEEAAAEGRFIKFVPASGAATRMFQGLWSIYLGQTCLANDQGSPDLIRDDPKASELERFFSGLNRFAFFEDLKEALSQKGIRLSRPAHQGQRLEVLDYLLTEKGLNYLKRPKGLHKFHTYPGHGRTAFEEHLVEAVHTVCDGHGRCRLHITVSPEHESTFKRFFETLRPAYENQYRCRFEVTFSFQSHSTNTVAVDLGDKPFRKECGTLLFRPGGHGALLQNLNALQGDLIYMKNIDNVLPDRLKEPTIYWKKILGGYLVSIQRMVHDYINRLTGGMDTPELLREIEAFCRDRLWGSAPPDLKSRSLKDRKTHLLEVLNRPIRVCGMVKNEGEPGGGPFWVEDKEGRFSRQIVESAQVDFESSEQRAIWASSTHFNPVDLVCSVRNYKGQPFDLNQYVDAEAVFISRKSENGRPLKALELPGLWNGAMARWLTLFVEIPDQTFSPVKTINDLLKPDHLSE